VYQMNQSPITLTGFNNLKKVLSFSFYDFVIVTSEEEKCTYIDYINRHYTAEKITKLLYSIVKTIEAEVLHTSLQDYEPYGASSLVLLGDIKGSGLTEEFAYPLVYMHLDKSHITAHTYPDFNSPDGILSFRVDIELSTCGEITPLKSLNEIFGFFDTDIVTIDYVVRGFTRNEEGKHIYMDHHINSIRDYIDEETLKHYKYKDLILQNDNIWQLKLLRTDMKISEYFSPSSALSIEEKQSHIDRLNREMLSIFHGWRGD